MTQEDELITFEANNESKLLETYLDQKGVTLITENIVLETLEDPDYWVFVAKEYERTKR